jgi:hypothetical protein
MTTEQMDWVDDHRGDTPLFHMTPGGNIVPGEHTIPGATPAQEVMRAEMTAGQAVDQLLGPVGSDAEVSELAVSIIKDSPSLSLTLQEWSFVQSMIEQGIRAGRAQRSLG